MFNIANKSKKVSKPKAEKPRYTCMSCLEEKKEDDFYKSQWTRWWNFSNKRVLFCKDCIAKAFEEYTKRYDEKTALVIMCAILDIPFYAVSYRSIIENNSFFSLGLYARLLNGRQYQYKCFLNSLVEGELLKTEKEVKEERETRWKKEDKQNMSYAISVVGYDPFDDGYLTDEDRKFLFNSLAGYCDDSTIRSDSHKIQSIIQIAQAQLQCKKLDEFINMELLTTSPDEGRVKSLTDTKKKLLDSITKIAQDNQISSNYSANTNKGANTLSGKIKELSKDNFEKIKVNLFDIKTAEAMKQIADLSNQSIVEQLNFDANDYTEMIKEQRELISKYEFEKLDLEEENRILKLKLQDLKNKKKR